MIHWLQTNLEKHFKWLFIFLLAVVIVSFVFTIGAANGIGEPDTRVNKNIYCGFNLNDPQVVQELEIGAFLSQLMGITPPVFGFRNPEQAVLSRIILLHLADEMNVPNPDEAALKNFLQYKVPFFQDEAGQFDAARYQQFVEQTSENPALGSALVTQILEQDFRIAQIIPSLKTQNVLAYEVEYQEMMAQTQWSMDIAVLDRNQIAPQTQVTIDELKDFYEKNIFRYQALPERGLTYVAFDHKNFVNQVPTPDDDRLKNFFERHRPLFQTDATDEPTTLTFEGVGSASVEASYRIEKSKELAVVAATDWLTEIYEKSIPYKSDAFYALIQQFGLKLDSIEPFGVENIPNNTPFAPGDLAQAFGLTSEDYYSNLFNIPNGVGIFFLDRDLPAHAQPFEQVESKVRADYQQQKQEADFNQAGVETFKQLQQALADGSTFADAAKNMGLDVISYQNIALDDAPRDLSGHILSYLPQSKVGEVSHMITVKDKGYFIYVSQKNKPQINRSQTPDFDEKWADLKESTSILSFYGLLQELIEKGLERQNQL